MGKIFNSIIDGIAKEVNNAREQLYDTSEQLRTGQTVYDRTQQDSLQHHQIEEKQPEQPIQEDREPER